MYGHDLNINNFETEIDNQNALVELSSQLAVFSSYAAFLSEKSSHSGLSITG